MSPDDHSDALLERRPVHAGRIVNLSIDTVRFPDGSVGELEFIRHSGASAIVPFLDDPGASDPTLLLIRQYRYATGGPLFEVPAGRPEFIGEDWEVCARRELEEETGMIAGHVEYLTTIFTTPGFTDEQIRLFMGTDLRPGTSSLDRDEFVDPVPMPLSSVLEKIRDGSIVDAKTICAVLFVAGFRLGH